MEYFEKCKMRIYAVILMNVSSVGFALDRAFLRPKNLDWLTAAALPCP